ncbi:MAG: helix-turn-helix transcriptional regulator [Bacteroidales bacterium]|nr:helix-turn-helix transcriptional regulator [Bacteroidales bacterium]
MTNKKQSTFDRIMSDSDQETKFDQEYSQFLFSELLVDAMKEKKISVRSLSKESGISTSIIQNMRSMKPVNITLKTMASLLAPLGYILTAKKGRKTVKLSS